MQCVSDTIRQLPASVERALSDIAERSESHSARIALAAQDILREAGLRSTPSVNYAALDQLHLEALHIACKKCLGRLLWSAGISILVFAAAGYAAPEHLPSGLVAMVFIGFVATAFCEHRYEFPQTFALWRESDKRSSRRIQSQG